MKKVYLFLTLALLCCVDAFCAVFTPGEMKATIAAGDCVFIGSPYSVEGIRDYDFLKWLSNRKNILTYTEGETPISADVFVVEAATQTVNGKAAFYLKNERQGLYVKAKEIPNGGAEDDLISSSLIFTEDVAEACPFAIVSATEGAKLMGYDGEREVPADAFMLLTQSSRKGEWLALNQAYSVPTVVTYNDWATWFEVYTAEAMEDPLTELIDLFLEVETAAFVSGAESAHRFVGGTRPGMRADTTAVNNFYKLFAEIYEFIDSGEAELNPDACSAKTAQLKDAYYGLLKTEVIPMHEGYYRFVNAGDAFLERGKYMAMYASGNKAMWGPKNESAVNQVWEVKKNDGNTWLVKNMDTQMYFLNNSDGVVMGATTENYTVFEALDIDGQFWIKMQDPNTPLHANNHQNGAGTGSNIVVWNAGVGTASAWFIEELSEEELADINEKNEQVQLNNKFAALLADARNKYNVATEYKPLLTSAEQIRSNASQNEWGSADGDGYPALIDGDPQTFFHSCWGNGPDEPHYLAFTLNEEVSDPLRFSWTRRVTQDYNRNNCPSNVTLAIAPAGADTTLAESWTTIAELTEMHNAVSQDTPTYSSWETYELPFPAKYVRWTVTMTGPALGICGEQYFFTMGEFQLYGGLNPDCQLAQMGEVGTAFKAAIDEALTVETVTQADIDKLQAALDAFVAELVDPTELENLITEIGTMTADIVYGTNPGQFPEHSAEEAALSAALEQARALINSGDYTKTSLAEAVEALNAAYNAFMATRKPITDGYYRLVSAMWEFEMYQDIRYAMCAENDGLRWKPYDTEAAEQVWCVKALGNNQYTLLNAGNARYVVAPDKITLSMAVDKMGDEPVDEVTINFFGNASSARIKINNSPDLHAGGHQNGWGTGGQIVFWNGEYNNASAWTIEPLSEEEAQKYDEMLQSPEQNRISKEFRELLAEAEKQYTAIVATDSCRVGDALITEVEQLSSNADHNTLTGYEDGGGLAALIDGDAQTYFHSIWSNSGAAPAAYHNLTVDLRREVDNFIFAMTARRLSGSGYVRNRPTKIILYGAKEGADVSAADSWEQLTVLTGLPDAELDVSDDDLNYSSPNCKLPGAYRYLRFEVTETNNGAYVMVGGKEYPFFSMAEFQVYPVQQIHVVGDYGETGAAFEEAYRKALLVETPTQQDIDELRTAMEDFVQKSRKVDFRVTPAGFATLMLPFDAPLPQGIKAYATSQATEMNEAGVSVLTLEKQETLQAHTPYIIQGEAGAYCFIGTTGAHEDTYTSGWLTGTYVDTTAQAGTYVLQNQGGRIGFYRVAEGSEPAVKANRAWLTVPEAEGDAAEVTAFVFVDGTTTGVAGVETTTDKCVDVYTLAGVRVRTRVRQSEALQGLPRGVYVVSGTKKTVK